MSAYRNGAHLLVAHFEAQGVEYVGVPVDYRDSPGLMAALHEDVLH